ncbi:MAG: ATP-binding cassette domain-containing protein [Planctomycetes bacterium]|nr:ATP-binding cassette domain-containing protein [Planctomycetota bacterium]
MPLQLVRITHAYGRHASLDSVDLNLENGDRYGFLGHNGAGKTTALRIALGLLRPRAGQVIVDGFDAAAHPREARARMGGMIEITGFHPAWSGWRNLLELARLQGLARGAARREASRLLELVGLAPHGDRAVLGYSQGMRQRLSLAQALIGQPRYVLLDEPTNGLDPEGIAELRVVLERLTGEGVTTLLSSHQLHEISTLCNRIGVLKGGRMLVEAPMDELLHDTRQRYEIEIDDAARAAACLARLGRPFVSMGNAPVAQAQPVRGLVELGAVPPQTLLAALVAEGVGVTHFAARPTTLEEVYLRLGAQDARTAPLAVGTPLVRDGVPRETLAPKGGLARMFRYEFARGLRPGVIAVALAPAMLAVWRMVALVAHDARNHARLHGTGADRVASISSITAYEATARVLITSAPLAIVLVAALGSQSIAGEFSLGTLRNVLLRPLTRVQVALGKALAVGAGSLLVTAVLVLVALAAAAIAFPFGDRLELGQDEGLSAVLMPAEEIAPLFLPALLSLALPMLAYGAIGLLCGALARRSIWALATALGAVVVLDLSRGLGEPLGLERLLPAAYLPSQLLARETSQLEFFKEFALGSADARFHLEDTAWLVPGAWLVSSTALAAFLLLRRRVP